MIRVAAVDDHPLILRGLHELVRAEDDMQWVGEARDYGSMRTLLREQQVDVLLLDVGLPGRNGLEALSTLEAGPSGSVPRALVLSQHPESQFGLRAIRVGAVGYLNKGGDPELILEAIRTVALGRRYVTPELAHLLLEAVTGAGSLAPHESLSEREMQVLLMIAGGQRLSTIAAALSLSPKTVSVYRARLLAKLGVPGNAGLASYALRHGLIA